MSTGQRRGLSVEVQRRDQTWEKVGSGLSRGVVPEAIQYSHAFDGSIGGPQTASFVLHDKAHRSRPDLEHFTPVVIKDGVVPVFSGRVIRTPEVRGEQYQRSVEVQGWKEHLKDNPLDKVWVVSDLSKWQDGLSMTGGSATPASYSKGVSQFSGDQYAVTLSGGRAAYATTLKCWGQAILDLGPNNVAKRIVATYAGDVAGAGTNAILYARSGQYPDLLNPGSYTDAFSDNTITTAPETSAGTFSTGYRYVILGVYYAGVSAALGSDYWLRFTDIQVFTDTADESGNESILKASTVIGETLTAKCPLISSDQSGITATSFVIPEFHTGLPGYMYPNEILEAVNAYHGYQCLLSNDATARFKYRAVPTAPTYAVGKSDGYSFENPGTYDGSEVYSQVIASYTDAAGVPGVAVVGSPTAPSFPALSGKQLSNPSMDTNTTGWSGYTTPAVTIARDTGTYDSTPASLSWQLTAPGLPATIICSTSSWTSALTVGKAYKLTGKIKASVADVTTSIECIIRDGTTVTGGSRLATDSQNLTDTNWHDFSIIFTPISSSCILCLQATKASGTNPVYYVDTLKLYDTASTVVDRRGFVRTKLVEFRSRMTSAAATQIAQVILDSSQHPPLKGTLTIQGRIRRTNGTTIPVTQLQLGDAILLEDETDPNTGAIGRIGIIQEFSYNHDTDQATITIDSNQNFVANLLARM